MQVLKYTNIDNGTINDNPSVCARAAFILVNGG